MHVANAGSSHPAKNAAYTTAYNQVKKVNLEEDTNAKIKSLFKIINELDDMARTKKPLNNIAKEQTMLGLMNGIEENLSKMPKDAAVRKSYELLLNVYRIKRESPDESRRPKHSH